ncbi:chloride channel protein [Pacificibacter marinus]|uniref:Voltage-gated ClC-type chloride channel ClcB n=1 Tax=Pacificibacter marinus TaxID=658057 RepID=A0A1Y5SHJ7_9RHOB|nr:chloride channel protein [Pacificibacter marinus]SEK62838.1 chloride channel protein, CIC family [Pacificibacter marinus]SLN40857.1 Voltage-gated ClC-type chloride channel ClcB [Pacificibacter marinus]
MAEDKISYPKKALQDVHAGVLDALRLMRLRGPSQIQFWFIALLIGIASGLAALFFRKWISGLQSFFYGAEDVHLLHSAAGELPWFWVLSLPVLGGLAVGVVLNWFTPDGRVRSVADVIEGAALNNGRVEKRAGLASAVASLITLSTGGSTGREGPVVHLAAVISSWVSNRLHANGITGRDLLGCAVAGAVSASFNAPIAGALFALEVILRHFAVHAFAPIAIAAVAGTVINRLEFGDVTEFTLAADGALSFYVELPAFVLLGAVCGLIAVLMMRSIFMADDFGTWVVDRIHLPPVFRPALAGLLLGLLAIVFPHIIGVGYETTSAALTGQLLIWQAIVFTVVKVIAVAITMAGRMGGGVFSPALMVGAMVGLAFGLIATAVFPDVSGTATLYALAGMGAVAAAVLGAPISTTLIVFELTGDWQTGLAVMVAVSLSTAIASKLVDRSFFLTLLERRDVHLAAGPQAYLLATVRVHQCYRGPDAPRAAKESDCKDLISKGIYISPNETLEKAIPMFETHNLVFIPVVTLREETGPELHGALFHVDALRVFSKALADTAAEEHS